MFNALKWQSGTALLLGCGMLASTVAPFLSAAPTLAQSTLADIQGNWAQGCITQLSQQGIISGYPDGTFKPGAPVTRAEFAAMVGKAFPNAARTRSAMQFVDVPSNFWAYNVIESAAQTGFLSGYPGNVFNPNQSIPRAQVLVALASGLNYTPTQSATATLNANFTDANAVPSYAVSGIAAATERRLVVDYPDVKFLNPNQLASRAEVAAFLCQATSGTGVASGVPQQYIAGNATSPSVAMLSSGTSIPVKYSDAKKIIVSPTETAPLTLTVAQNVTNAQGTVVIPAGSQVVGQLRPATGGSQFVASSLVVNGRQTQINATSNVVTTTQNTRSPNFLTILQDSAIGSAVSAAISGLAGDKHITATKVLTGTVAGAAVGASQNRNILSSVRDAALGAIAGTGIAGVTGDHTITAGKVLGGAAAGAVIGGIADHGPTNQVVVINPNADLTLTLNSDLTTP